MIFFPVKMMLLILFLSFTFALRSFLLDFSFCFRFLDLLFWMDGDSGPPAGTGAGFVSGNETTFNFTDDVVVPSDIDISRSASGL